ncbi:MAG: aspartate carbamoyltransferase catalytic subunit [Vampirovibrionia bacterium]
MSNFYWNRKHIVDIGNLSVKEIEIIMDLTDRFFVGLEQSKIEEPILKGKKVLTLFYENSTRTRCSFELAAKNLGAETIDISVATSAVKKGETLADTVDNLVAMGVDAVVVRHSSSGICEQLARTLFKEIPVLNAGDGLHEHPSQGLLDFYTMRKALKDIKGKKITIVGDILHSRVAHSNISLLNKFGADVHIVGPSTLLPFGIEKMGVTKHHFLEPAIENADLIMMLRMQLERQKAGIIPSLGEYINLYGLTRDKMQQYCKPGVFVMHPGPMNRAVEISSDLADDPKCSLILDQVKSGVAVRMALLTLTLKGGMINENVA